MSKHPYAPDWQEYLEETYASLAREAGTPLADRIMDDPGGWAAELIERGCACGWQPNTTASLALDTWDLNHQP